MAILEHQTKVGMYFPKWITKVYATGYIFELFFNILVHGGIDDCIFPL